MSTASEKAADRMHADLDAMALDAQRHTLHVEGQVATMKWMAALLAIKQARSKIAECMSERDRRIAGG